MRRRRGLSLVEVLITMGIMGTLLTAVAAALSASVNVVKTNDEFFRSAQAARVTMNLLIAEVRRCKNVVGMNSTALQIISDNDRDLTWTYVPPAGSTPGQITLTDASTGIAHVLARNVKSATFRGVMGTNANNTPCVVQVIFEITTEIDDSALTLSSSVAPRVNMIY